MKYKLARLLFGLSLICLTGTAQYILSSDWMIFVVPVIVFLLVGITFLDEKKR